MTLASFLRILFNALHFMTILRILASIKHSLPVRLITQIEKWSRSLLWTINHIISGLSTSILYTGWSHRQSVPILSFLALGIKSIWRKMPDTMQRHGSRRVHDDTFDGLGQRSSVDAYLTRIDQRTAIMNHVDQPYSDRTMSTSLIQTGASYFLVQTGSS